MTSWVWMKGIDEAVADPQPPVHDQDKRPAVKDLIAKHREKIDEVKTGLNQEPLYDPSKHDDLWICRFILSHKKPKKALRAAIHTLNFRKEHNLDAEDIRYASLNAAECKCESVKRYFAHAENDFGQVCIPDGRLGVVIFLRMAALDQHSLVKHVSKDDWLPAFCYVNEWCFQWCDYLTRTSGRLTKFIRVVDAAGCGLSWFNVEANKRDGHAMNAMEDCYPQGMQSFFLCHPPALFGMVWGLLRPIIPKRVLDKFEMMNPDSSEKDKKKLLPYIAEEHLPTRFGGKYELWPIEHALPQ